jgi:LuxR family maltose regulon positive regulatory protein
MNMLRPGLIAGQLVMTKLEPARPLGEVIPRPRFEAQRRAARNARVVSIVAPPGSGKSTLMAEWRRRWIAEGLSCVWLSLDSDDDSVSQFLLHLCTALRDVSKGVGDQPLTLLTSQGVAAHRVIVSMLVNGLHRCPRELILLLDDFHVLSDPSVRNVVDFLIVHAPSSFRLVVASREPITLHLAPLFARGQCLVISALELQFDEAETTAFIDVLPPDERDGLDPALLLKRTEGWPAAVRIASLDRSGAVGAIERGRVPGADWAARSLDRMIEGVVDGLPRPIQRFLAATSIFDRFDAELCAAATAEPDAAVCFEQMRHSGLLVETIDPERKWVRHHALLRSYLSGTLIGRLGVDVVPLHRRAAVWFAEHSQWVDAVRHAIAAGELKMGSQWLSRCALELVQKGDLLTLTTWARLLPAAMLRDKAGVQLALAWGYALAMRFDESEKELALLEGRAREHPDPAHRSNVLGHACVVRIVKAALQDDDDETRRLVDTWGGPNTVDRWAANSVSSTQRWLDWHAGNWVGMYAQPWVSGGDDGDLRDVFTEVYRGMLLGSAEFERGRFALAEIHARRAIEDAERAGGTGGIQTAVVLPILAAIRYERGDLEEAEALLRPSLVMIDHGAMLHCVALAYLCLARIAYRSEPSGEQAYRRLEQARKLGQSRGWSRLVTAMLLQQLDWLTREQRIDEASACLEQIRCLCDGAVLMPRRPRSELAIHLEWGTALLSLRAGEASRAMHAFQRLQAVESSFGNLLSSIRLGVAFADACDASGDHDAAERAMLKAVQSAAAVPSRRSVLDHGPRAIVLLRRVRSRPDCNDLMGAFIDVLLMEHVEPNALDAAPPGVLTAREVSVLELVGNGLPNKLVARELGVSVETVKTHLSRSFVKLGVVGRVQAVATARSRGLIP